MAAPSPSSLLAAANEATRLSGWGRIKHRDGTFEDIAPHNGGIVRTVLDSVVPHEVSDDEPEEEEEEETEDPGMHEEEPVNWQ